uniref:Insulinase family protein n=1 Tax=uncultured Alphaproteobacteria bacterium TaxID=91750 RepID=A0A5Q5AQE3_9PROT|nr:insulinase family protein [uncultured Alphaproteobacteria bacterium]
MPFAAAFSLPRETKDVSHPISPGPSELGPIVPGINPGRAPMWGPDLILAGGAEGYPAGETGERFADLNAEASLYVAAADHVIGELTVEKANLDETIGIANAHLRAPGLDQVWFERIRDGFAKGIAEGQAQPLNQGFAAVRWAVLGNQPLRVSLSLDEPGVIERLTVADVAAWHREVITARPEAIVVAGALDAKAAGAAVDALLAGLPAAGRDMSRAAQANWSPRRILLHRPKAEATVLSFVGPLPSTREPGEIEDLILAGALGGGDQSVLFKAVRTELRASYGFGAGIANYTRELRMLVLSGEVAPDRLAEVEPVVRKAYAGFRTDGPGGDLAARKAPLEENFRQLPEFVIDVASAELQSLLDGYDPGRALALPGELEAIDVDSLSQRLREDWPSADNLIVIAVSPDADALPGACVITAPEQAADCP